MLSGLESPWHLLIVLVIAMIVLGPKRLPELGRSLGSGIRGFRASLNGEEKPEDEETAEPSGEKAGGAAKTSEK